MTSPASPSAPGALRRHAIFAAKLTLIVLLMGYLIRSGKLSVKDLTWRPETIHLLGVSLALMLLTYLMSFSRHRLLLDALEIRMRTADVTRIGFIGAFFNTFMPGGFGGDVVRIAYVMRETGKRAGAVASVMVDRFLGLLGLFAVGGVSLFIHWRDVVATPSMHTLALAVFGLLGACGFGALTGVVALAQGRRPALLAWAVVTAGMALFAAIALGDDTLALRGPAPASALLRGRAAAVLAVDALLALAVIPILPSFLPGRTLERTMLIRLPGGRSLSALIHAILAYHNRFSAIAISFLLSMALQAVGLFALYFLALSMRGSASPGVGHIFFAAPPTLLANALPISFGGLGVGEGVFDKILSYCLDAAGHPVRGGAAIFLAYRVLTVLINLIGLPLYLRGRRETTDADLERAARTDPLDDAAGDRP